jgi:NADH-quinone oxidoreductase subunit J
MMEILAFYAFAAITVIASLLVVGQGNPMHSVMLLNVPREEAVAPAISALLGPTGMRLGVVLSVLLAVEVVWALSRVGIGWFTQGTSAASVSSVALIGNSLFTRHAFAFEATSILILVAMVGAVVLAGRERH